jgi:hypothetical protein
MYVLASINVRGMDSEHFAVHSRHSAVSACAIVDGMQGKLDLQNVVLCGHSYGGATMASTPAPQLRIRAAHHRGKLPMHCLPAGAMSPAQISAHSSVCVAYVALRTKHHAHGTVCCHGKCAHTMLLLEKSITQRGCRACCRGSVRAGASE